MKNVSMSKGTLFLVAVLMLLGAMDAEAENGDLVWAKAMGGTGEDVGNCIVVDSAGNVYTTGRFEGTTDFDPGAGTFNLTSAGGDDIFVLKLDNAGSFVWAKNIGGTGDDNGYGIVVDSAGNVYTTGRFERTVDFDPGAGTFNLTSAGGDDIFVSKLDNTGNFVWAEGMGGPNDDYSSGIVMDSVDNVYTTGRFVGTADFDPGAGTFNLISAGGYDIFISKIDSDGNFVWAKGMGGESDLDNAIGIAVDSTGNIYTTGYFSTADFDPGVGTFTLTSVGVFDIFVSKLDNDGNFIWAKAMGGTGLDSAHGIMLDSAGNVYTTGNFQGTADFDPGAVTFELASAGDYDIFVSKLDSDGNFVWAKNMGGTSGDYGYGIAVDSAGDIYTTGRFQGTADFDPGVGVFNLISAGSGDIFVSKIDSDGNTLWTRRMGGMNDDWGYEIMVNSTGDVYTTGRFSDTADFDPETCAFNLTSAGDYDIFVLKLGVDVTPPGISIGSPSPGQTTTGPVTYVVSYCDEDVVSLTESDITLDITGDVTAMVTVTHLGGSDWEVLLSAITGTGTLGFTIAPNTAVDEAGNFALSASTVELVQVVPEMPLAVWPVLLTLLVAGATTLHRKRKSRT